MSLSVDELVKKAAELLGRAADAAGAVGPEVWRLLVDAERATALAEFVSVGIALVMALSATVVAVRAAKLAASAYAAAERRKIEIEAASDRYRSVDDPAARFSVIAPGVISIVIAVCTATLVSYIWKTLPDAVARRAYPDAFAAKALIDRAVPLPPTSPSP